MAAAFCSNCGTPLDASGVCQRGCGGAPPVEPAVATSAGYGQTALPGEYAQSASPGGYSQGPSSGGYGPPPSAAPYAAAPLTRFSGMWNWGAFLLCPFWLMNHGALWLGIGYLVVSLVPFFGIVALGMAIYFGIKGNDWAVQHRTFASEEQFVAVQNAWRNWGIFVALIGIVLGIIGAIFVGILGALSGVHHHY
jgi:hypothetical protein